MRPLDLRDLWGFGEMQLLPLIREGYLRNSPASELMPLLVSSFVNLRTWRTSETNREEFPEAYSQSGQLFRTLLSVYQVEESAPLPTELIDRIVNYFRSFEEAFRHELAKVPSYVLEEKRGFGVRTLVDRAYKIISTKNHPYLSEFAQHNIGEAGRCFVFDCFTATGYHSTRAVEDVARSYYTLVTERRPYDVRNGNLYFHGMGKITNELRDVLTSIKSSTAKHLLKAATGNLGSVVAFLEQICLVYRDPLSHPDIIALDEDGAADVFFQCVEAISSMLNDVRERSPHVKQIWLG